MSEHDFEQRLALELRDYAEQGVEPFDAVAIARAAAGGRTRPAPTGDGTQRRLLPVPATWLLTTTLLLLGLFAATAFAAGWLRLPTQVGPSPTPTGPAVVASPSPSPSASFSPVPLPTFPPLDTPPASATGSPDAGTTAEPGPSLTAEPGATSEPSPGPSAQPSPTAEPSVDVTQPPPSVEPEPTAAPTAPPPVAVTGVAAGSLHTCAVRQDGTVSCWGENEFGELGDGSRTNSFTPVTVVGLDDATAVATGIRFSCALRAGGSVACWGESPQDGDPRLTPELVPGASNATALAAGGAFACALRSAGTVVCWGENSLGQLGNGTTTSGRTATPVQVAGIDDAVELQAGWNHACVRRSGGSVACWGGNGDGATGYGQLGDGTLENRSTPVAVSGISNARAIAAGGWHTCALLADGSATCWGYNGSGGLGDGTTQDSSVPVPVVGLSNARRITAGGGWHTCALTGNGRVRCWGDNRRGQLGDGSTTDRSTPVAVRGISGVRSISAGWLQTCAVAADRAVWCWGLNFEPSPTPVPGASRDVVMARAGYPIDRLASLDRQASLAG